ncbi:MAG TPA: CHAT domain-containing protein [Caulobacteraceae bacterium]
MNLLNPSKPSRFAVVGACLAIGALLLLWAPGAAVAGPYDDFSLGANAEHQPCRGVWRFESAKSPTAVDLYCGDWEAPSGMVRLAVHAGEAATALATDCPGEGAPISGGDGLTILQTACARAAGAEGPRRFGLVARSGAHEVYGSAFPSDWGPMVAAARVLLKLDKPGAAARSQTALTPGLREIEAVYPDGPPGQGAALNYELLRRRGYEKNVAWSFESSQRDFSELLRAHQKVAPNDTAGEAEILAEVALNLSDSRRFADAGDLLDRAEAEARAADDGLLLSKIGNYRAVDALNRGQNAQALKLALEANAARDRLLTGSAEHSAGATITPADARALDARDAPRSRRALLSTLEEVTPAEKAQVLTAQGYEIAAAAAAALGRDDTGRLLDQALSHLAQSEIQPAWLAGLIYEQRSALDLAAGDATGADREAKQGLRRVRELAPQTRIEARLMLAAERAELAMGDRTAALTNGRAAVAILERQSEAPGMPADEAAAHIEALLGAYEQAKDPALANEYFETLSLVWDGAASRAAAELAARLSDDKGGDAIKAYQDAQRDYRTALARRVRISATEAPAAEVAQVDHDTDVAARALSKAEAVVRESSPRYLELLNPEVSTPDLLKVLRRGEGYVSLVLAHDRGYGALVTQQGVTPYRIALTADQARAMVTAIRQSAVIKGRRLPDYDLADARKLYRALIEPIDTQIATLKMLHIDGGGILAALPVAALLASDPTDAQVQEIKLEQNYAAIDWFARHHDVDIALGPAVFVRTRTVHAASPSTTVMAFGDFRPDPVVAAQRIADAHSLSDVCRREVEKALYSLKALPDTAQEARSDAAVFGAGGTVSLGQDFTANAFLDSPQVADAQVLVLATHGVLGLSTCFAEPALLTSVGAQGDGLIEASELLNRSLKARLVVLSACDTAGGGGALVSGAGLADGGEALSGLARAFIYAGSPGVLATLWKIDAAASATQTSVLLRTAAEGGRSLAEALGVSQKALYDQAETGHPFYWSGFVLIGDGAAVLASPKTQTAQR